MVLKHELMAWRRLRPRRPAAAPWSSAGRTPPGGRFSSISQTSWTDLHTHRQQTKL